MARNTRSTAAGDARRNHQHQPQGEPGQNPPPQGGLNQDLPPQGGPNHNLPPQGGPVQNPLLEGQAQHIPDPQAEVAPRNPRPRRQQIEGAIEELDAQGNSLHPEASYSANQAQREQRREVPLPNYEEAVRNFLRDNQDNLRRYLAEQRVPLEPRGGHVADHPQAGGHQAPHQEALRHHRDEAPRREEPRRAFDEEFNPLRRNPEPHVLAGFARYGPAETPFTRRILETPLPRGYKTPAIPPFDGLKDPQNFLSQFKYSAMNQQLDEVHMCKLFPELLIDNARRWFDNLPRGSISSYNDLMEAFYRRFSQKAESKTTSAHLLTVRQQPGESISDFMTRFNTESLKVEDVNDLLIISAFQNGILPGALYREIIKYEPRTVAELWRIADRFAKADDADRRKREVSDKGKKKDDNRGGQSSRSAFDRLQKPPVQSRLGPQQGPLQSRLGPRQNPEPNQFTPLTKSRGDIYELHANLFAEPRPMRKGQKRRSQDKYCSFHKDHGHDTEECRNLAADIESLVQKGTLKKYQVRQPGQKKGKRRQEPGQGNCRPAPEKKQRQDSDDDDEDTAPQYDGVIGTINGVSPGTTRSSLKSEARNPPTEEPSHKRFRKEEGISFTDADPVPAITPHTDAILIEVVIANKLVQRVHVDTGASVSVLFKACFDKLELGSVRLSPAPIPLRSFAQEETHPEGSVSLPVTVGQAPKSSTQVVQFFVVKAASPYNIILGRDWLNAVRAICSTYHLTVKLPTKGGVAVLRGDQKRAKECMQYALKQADTSARCPQA